MSNHGQFSYLTHLECGLTGEQCSADQPRGLSSAGRPLLARYDLAALRSAVTPADWARRPAELWRYHELLPIRDPANIVSLGEPITPLLPAPRLARGDGQLWFKDESRLPTASFKARGLCLAVSKAKELGVRRLAMPTNGNAGAALAAYAARAGMEAFVLCPRDTPTVNVREIAAQGAQVWLVDGLIHDCGKIVAARKQSMGWFDCSTLKEPYRLEGKKTMGLELAEQFGWRLPDFIFYPTGGGTGLIGMWKAFQELRELGWLTGPLPKMVAVQAAGCAPIVKAWDEGTEFADVWPNAHTVASGIRVPAAVGDFLMLRVLRESGGFAIAVDDEDILAARALAGNEEGMLLCPESAAALAAYHREFAAGAKSRVPVGASAVIFQCASGLKYPLPAAEQPWPDAAAINR